MLGNEKYRADEIDGLKKIWKEAMACGQKPDFFEPALYLAHCRPMKDYWDDLYPMLSEIRALPVHDSDIREANKFRKLYRKDTFYLPDAVMREQRKVSMIFTREMIGLGRVLRQPHSQIDVMKLNPREIALRAHPPKERSNIDWDHYNLLAKRYGYDENGNMLDDPEYG